MGVPMDIIDKAEQVARFDGVRRFVVESAERFPNGNRVPAIRLQLREGDELVYATEAGGQTYDEAVERDGREAVHARLAR